MSVLLALVLQASLLPAYVEVAASYLPPAKDKEPAIAVTFTPVDANIRVNEDPFTIQLRDPANRFHSFRKSDTKAIEKEFGKSLMPSYRGRLTDAETEDLVAYLASLRGER